MIPPRYRILIATVPMIAVGSILVATLSWHGNYVSLVVGIVLGTLFGQVSIAAAWTALGPGTKRLRIPLSLVWLATLIASVAFNVMRHSEGDATEMLIRTFLGQWLLAQLPLWALVVTYGWRLTYRQSTVLSIQPSNQFGIHQLMIFTAVVAVTFGAGRMIVVHTTLLQALTGHDLVFALLGVVAVVISLPLLIAALLPRKTLLLVAGVLFLVAIATIWEPPVLHQISGGDGHDHNTLVSINLFTCAWVLAFVLATRLNGYALVRRNKNGTNQVAPTP